MPIHRPLRPVTIANGELIPAWFDILKSHAQRIGDGDEDEPGMVESIKALENGLIANEVKNGIATNRIVVAGFSQGAGLAILESAIGHVDDLAGIVLLSGYLPLAWKFKVCNFSFLHFIVAFSAHLHLNRCVTQQRRYYGAMARPTPSSSMQPCCSVSCKVTHALSQCRNRSQGCSCIARSRCHCRRPRVSRCVILDNLYRRRTDTRVGMGHSYCDNELDRLYDWLTTHLPPLAEPASKM